YCKYKLINVFEENGMWDNRYNPNVFKPNNDYFHFVGHGTPLWTWAGDGEGISPDFLKEKIKEGNNAAKQWLKNKVIDYISTTADVKDTITESIFQALFKVIEKEIGVLEKAYEEIKDAIEKIEEAIDDAKSGIEKLKEWVCDLKSNLADSTQKLKDAINKYTHINDAANWCQKKIADLKAYLSSIPKHLYEKVKEWFSFAWHWVTRSKNNPEYTKTSNKISAEQQNLSQLKQDRQKAADAVSQLTLKKDGITADIQKKSIGITDLETKTVDLVIRRASLLSKAQDLWEKIQRVKNVMGHLRDITFKLDNVYERIADKTVEEVKDCLAVEEAAVSFWIDLFYRPLYLTDEEKYLVEEYHRPWTHNPAHLCWVYLSHGSSTRSYFNDHYLLNDYMEDLMMYSNFNYSDGYSTPKSNMDISK
ncbi:MAG: hypothetical protein ACRCUT_10140, partial [Spirochaetota bacterium]